MLFEICILMIALAGVIASSSKPRAALNLFIRAAMVMSGTALAMFLLQWIFKYVDSVNIFFESPVFVLGSCYFSLFLFGYTVGQGESDGLGLLQRILAVVSTSVGIPLLLTSYLIRATPSGDGGLGVVFLIPFLFSGTIFPIIGLVLGRARSENRGRAGIRHAR